MTCTRLTIHLTSDAASPTVSAMKNKRVSYPFPIAVVVAAVLLMQPLYANAQQRSPASEQSEKEKAKMQEKRASQREVDEAYKSTIKRIPDAKQSVDPWSSMRTAPQK